MSKNNIPKGYTRISLDIPNDMFIKIKSIVDKTKASTGVDGFFHNRQIFFMKLISDYFKDDKQIKNNVSDIKINDNKKSNVVAGKSFASRFDEKK